MPLEWEERTEEYSARDSNTLFHGHYWWLHKAAFSRLEPHSNTTWDVSVTLLSANGRRISLRVSFESRGSIRSLRFAFLLQPLLQTVGMTVVSSCIVMYLKSPYRLAQNIKIIW